MSILSATPISRPKICSVSELRRASPTASITPYLLQGGLGIPSRDYYLGIDAKMKAVPAVYKIYIAAALKLTGITDSDLKAVAVFDLETMIAKVCPTFRRTKNTCTNM